MKRIIKWIGRILMILAIMVIAGKLWNYRESIEIEWNFSLLMHIGICCLFYALIVYLCPFVYQCALYITTGRKLGYVKVALTYCKSNILKYLPGNVMQYVGRNELAVKEDMPHGEVALATVLEIVVTVLSSAFVGVVFSWSYAVEWITKFVNIDITMVLLAALGVLVVGICFLAFFRKKFWDYAKKILRWKNVLIFLGMVFYLSIIMLFNSLLYFNVLSCLGIHLELRQYFVGIGLYATSFLLGYVTLGAPGGIGIREAVLVYFFSSFIQESQILTGSVIFRIVSIIGDFTALGIALAAGKLVYLIVPLFDSR